MKNNRTYIGLVCLLFVAMFAVAMYCVPVSAAKGSPVLTITLTNKGIQVPATTPAGGDYTVVVKNNSSTPRGVELTGIDKGGSPYVRYTKVVAKGKTDKFAWFFPANERVFIKDVLKCEHASRTCVIATFGGATTSIKFR